MAEIFADGAARTVRALIPLTDVNHVDGRERTPVGINAVALPFAERRGLSNHRHRPLRAASISSSVAGRVTN